MKYIVEGPDGKRYIVEGPAGAVAPPGAGGSATPPAPAASEGSQTAPDKSLLSSAQAGLADAGIRGFLGLKQFLGGLDSEEQGVLREQQADAENDPNKKTRIAGNIAGNVGLGVAGGGASLAAKIATMLPRWAAAAGSGAAVSGLQSLALSPGQGEGFGAQMADKAKQAGTDAALGGALGGAGTVLRRALTGMFKPTADAATLMSQGVTPTLQQGAEGRIGRTVGGLVSEATDIKQRQAQEILDALTARASGGKLSFQDLPLKDRTEMIENLLSGEYDKLLGNKRFPISPAVRAEIASKGRGIMTRTGQFVDEANEANRAIGNIMGDSPRNVNVGIKTLQQNYLSPLVEAAGEAKSSKVRDALMQARQGLIEKSRNTRLTPEEQTQLADIDSRWFDLSRLKETAQGSAGDLPGVGVRSLAQKFAKAADPASNRTREELVGPAMRVFGDTPTQDQIRSLMVGVKRTLGGAVGASAAMGNPYALARGARRVRR